MLENDVSDVPDLTFSMDADEEKHILYDKTEDKGRPLPKFGEWDVNDPASAEGFTVIFNKARDEKKTGGKPESPGKVEAPVKHGGVEPGKPQPVSSSTIYNSTVLPISRD
ncbi:hypothetical protein EZV62_009248 [Acer yangbiense]|uniref:RIN4 pathogenic type III effector avirulence factor Avr cleavage site domain-containing protein n=1 Tax=Acer yangbiense TaxID=1000413 RepID=A0A5C7IFH7_9ROSI|nr:hypothetical protein EZV62_009248 [Acer yangbiense]